MATKKPTKADDKRYTWKKGDIIWDKPKKKPSKSKSEKR